MLRRHVWGEALGGVSGADHVNGHEAAASSKQQQQQQQKRRRRHLRVHTSRRHTMAARYSILRLGTMWYYAPGKDPGNLDAGERLAKAMMADARHLDGTFPTAVMSHIARVMRGHRHKLTCNQWTDDCRRGKFCEEIRWPKCVRCAYDCCVVDARCTK